MESEEDLTKLLEIECDQRDENDIYDEFYHNDFEEKVIETPEPKISTNSVNADAIAALYDLDEDTLNILHEDERNTAIDGDMENQVERFVERKEDYVFEYPPDGDNAICTNLKGDMVFIRQNTLKVFQSSESTNMGFLSESIDCLIDQCKENQIRKDRLRKEAIHRNEERSVMTNWGDKYKPSIFMHLISDDHVNRIFMKWLIQWRPMLFNSKHNISTTEIDSLPYYCNECKHAGRHSTRCTSQQQLRPYYRPDLPSPLPTRPANPIVFLCGPTGCGKTTLIEIAAANQNLRIVPFYGEMSGINSQQTLEQIETVLETQTISFSTSKPPILLFDNFDSAFTLKERKQIVSFFAEKYKASEKDCEKRLVPVVFTCSDLYSCNSKELSTYSQQLTLPQVTSKKQIELIRRICTRENIPFETNGLKDLVDLSNGDMRFSLTALQSIAISADRISSQTVCDSLIGTKEVIKNINDYWNLIFLCRRSRGRSGYTMSNISQIFDHFCDIDDNKVIDGILEYLPTHPIPDPSFLKYTLALDSLIEYDIIMKRVHQTMQFSLQNVLPAYLTTIHVLYRRENATIKRVFPKSEIFLQRNVISNRDSIDSFKYSPAIIGMEGSRTMPLILDYISPLLTVITPYVRPVDRLLMTDGEKKQVDRITNIMISYGLSYESSQNANHLQVTINPNIQNLACYTGISNPFDNAIPALKLKIQAELQRTIITRGLKGLSDIGGDVTITSLKRTPEKKAISGREKIAKKTLVNLESPKKKIQVELKVDEKEIEKRMTPIKRTSFFNTHDSSIQRQKVTGIVFRFEPGFTCAVRQEATIKDFL